jgi:hypothetical protein
VHRKLRAAGVVADLIVFEGQSHAQYLFAPDALEGKEYFVEGVPSSKSNSKSERVVQHAGSA